MNNQKHVNAFAQSASPVQLYERIKFAEAFLAKSDPTSAALPVLRRTIERDAIALLFGVQS